MKTDDLIKDVQELEKSCSKFIETCRKHQTKISAHNNINKNGNVHFALFLLFAWTLPKLISWLEIVVNDCKAITEKRLKAK